MNAANHKLLKAELDATGLPYEIKSGSRHVKIYLDGRFVGVISRGSKEGAPRNRFNMLADIRRAARGRGRGQ